MALNERSYVLFLIYLYSEEARGEGINDDMDVIELTGNGCGIVVPFMFTPNNMDSIISDMPFL